MHYKVLRTVRLIIAATFAILYCLAFWRSFYPLPIFDMQFTATLQSGLISGFGVGVALLVIILLITLLFGRVYCSILCPLGLYQEFLSFLFKPFHKKDRKLPTKHYNFAYIAAAILFGMLLGGTVVILRMIDPYAIFGNAASGAAFGLGFMIALAILVFFKKRFFCTNICPVGTVLGLISKFSLFKIRIDGSKCKMCAMCAGVCPCGAIDYKNYTVNNETCIKCLRCLNGCNYGALYYGLAKAKPVKFSATRRRLLLSGLVLATFGTAAKGGALLAKFVVQKVRNVILPAGAGKVEDFANRCLNCNLCVKNCPMKIIKKADAEVPFVHLDYGETYCDFDCHKCSEICPSGAIRRISLRQKQKTKIASAVVNEDICIQCGLCARTCPRHAIIKERGTYPLVRFEECIGCGACAAGCPVKAISIEPVKQQVVLN